MSTLSPKQAELLEAMQRGVVVHFITGRDAHCFRSDTMQPCTATVFALLKRGLVQQVKDGLHAQFVPAQPPQQLGPEQVEQR